MCIFYDLFSVDTISQSSFARHVLRPRTNVACSAVETGDERFIKIL